MYTLRLFKKVDEINRMQICLGDYYEVKDVEDEYKKIGIKFRVFGGSSAIEGIAIYKDDYAYIMTENGRTFETLNRPK